MKGSRTSILRLDIIIKTHKTQNWNGTRKFLVNSEKKTRPKQNGDDECMFFFLSLLLFSSLSMGNPRRSIKITSFVVGGFDSSNIGLKYSI